jgi:hypothetical protein
MHRRWRRQMRNIGGRGGGGRGGRGGSGRNGGGRNGGGRGKSSKSGRGGGMHRRRRHALEALECIGSAWRRTELTEMTEPAVNTKCWRRCKVTSVRFLTSPIISHSPPVHMYSPSPPLYYLQESYLRPTTYRPDCPTTFQKSTHR